MVRGWCTPPACVYCHATVSVGSANPRLLKGHAFSVRVLPRHCFRRFCEPTAIERGRFHRPAAHANGNQTAT